MIEYLEQLPLGQVMAVIAVIWGIILFIRKTYPWMSRMKDFLDDLMGEPGRKGVPPHPGLMERMDIAEQKLASAEYHSKPNGGHSAYDDLMREVMSISTRLDEHIRDTT